jgi:hypothetical protein
LNSTKLQKNIDIRLEEGGELNVEGMWRGESKASASSQMQKVFFFFVFFFLFFYLRRRKC